MGRRRVKKDADQDIEPNEQALHAKKRLQEIHFSSHPLGAARSLPAFNKQTFTPFMATHVMTSR